MNANASSNRQGYSQPLVVHVLYHPEDANAALPHVNAIVDALTKDVRHPFSRTLNLPVFVWNRPTEDMFAQPMHGDLIIVLAMTSRVTQGDDVWCNFIEARRGNIRVLPLALDRDGLNLAGALSGKNAVRLYDRSRTCNSCATDIAVIQILHAIHRYAFAKRTKGRLRIFLSHAKGDGAGERWAVDIKHVIDADTTLGSFFDCTDIQPGSDFSREITHAINESALVLIGSDEYSSRHWCQREILAARDKCCPMIAVDCREEYEDRIFPFVNNMPRLHVPHSDDSSIRMRVAVRIVKSLLIEVVRMSYQRRRLSMMCATGIVPQKAIVSTCPPDAYTIGTRAKGSLFVYPDPCVFPEELDWYRRISANVITPYWDDKDRGSLGGYRIGISISDPAEDELQAQGLRADALVELAQILARQLVLRGATLIYGGDLRKKDKHGFTEYLLDEVSALRKHYGNDIKAVENHLAWPLSISSNELRNWKGHFRDVLKVVSYQMPSSDPTRNNRNLKKFLQPDGPESKATWAHCLSLMREKSIGRSSLRICAGGRMCGYVGKMPGVLEEILIALRQNKPLLLLGGFGGVVGSVVKMINEGLVDDCLSEDWQFRNNDRYDEMLDILRNAGVRVDYAEIVERLKSVSVKDLAAKVHLPVKTYSHMMTTPFVDDAVLNVMQAIRRIER